MTSNRWKFLAFFVLVFTLTSGIRFVRAYEPSIDESQVERLKNLPYGVSRRPSLIIRSRQVERVHFGGAGSSSKYGFTQESGIIKEGLWIRLRNSGPERWSTCTVEFTPQTDLSKYNSIIIYLRPISKNPQFILTAQDRGWEDKSKAQAKSSLFPAKGFSFSRIVQVVIPFKALNYKASLDYSRLQRIVFSFGQEATGNSEGEIAEIVGMAFVDQGDSLANKIWVVDPLEPIKKAPKEIVKAEPKKTKATPTPAPSLVLKPTPQSSAPMAITPINESTQVVMTAPAETTSFIELSTAVKTIEPVVPAVHQASTDRVVINPFKFIPDLPYILFSLLILSFGALLLIQRKNGAALTSLGPIFHKLSWPLTSEGIANSNRAEKRFWRKLSDHHISSAWISPYQAVVERDASDEHHGESFLRRQVKMARSAGVNLVPSLCFVRALFHFETFLNNPQLYLTKAIPPSEIHLSDEELRVRYIGYFPVWIPPYWQKQKGLPQKMLLAYGKMPGLMATSDSVQFNLRSPHLREMAVRVIERFAQAGTIGVRIEGASALINSSLSLYWGGAFPDTHSEATEFWEEVINKIKSRYPKFLFIADGSGHVTQKLKELGFDLFENDRVVDVLFNQVRLEEVGTLENLLAPEVSHLLSQSIYNVSPLFRILPPGSVHRQQSLLCGMILGFFPGIIEHDGQIPQELSKFYALVRNWPLFQKGRFMMLSTSSPEILSFARWEKKTLYIAVANFSLTRRNVSVRLEPFLNRLDDRKLYLFSDALHGATLLNDLKSEINQAPALAVLGQDLKEAGLYLSLPELSLRLFSVNLGTPLQNETPAEVRQLHKT